MERLNDSHKDFLTDCYTKEWLGPTLTRIRAECSVSKKPLTILVIDLDNFKVYNDKYGHMDGDEVLKYFSSTLRLSLGDEEAIPFRFGGDEFIILFPGKDSGEVYGIANEILKNLRRRPFLMRGRIFKMSFSGGIVSYPADGKDTEDLLSKADKAMYYSKTHGRGRNTQHRMMTIETVNRVVGLLVLVTLIAALLFPNLYIYNRRIVNFVNNIRSMKWDMASMFSPAATEELVSVRLVSGRTLKGALVHEGKEAIEIKLKLDKGEGSLVIKKSEIERIDKEARPAKAAERKK